MERQREFKESIWR